jgi:hypothetical protein
MRVARRSLVAAAAALALAGCGGGGHTATTTTTAATPAAQRAEVKRVWERFFAGKTSAADKVALLEDGEAFRQPIEAQASSPLARSSSATVNGVTLDGPAKATVRYSIDLGGKPALPNQKGTAVKVDGAWKVGRGSFCRLLSLQGPVPKACSANP